MPVPRIAICQIVYLRELDKALARAKESIRQAASRGADIVVFPEWFLGLNPVEVIPNRFTDTLSLMARELGLMIVTGSLRVLDNETIKKQQKGLVIDQDGTIVGTQTKMTFQPTERPWFEPGPGISAIHTRFGRLIILLGLDALDRALWDSARGFQPDIVVMATSPRNVAEQNELQDLAINHSLDIQGTVLVAPFLGRFSGQNYIGGAVIAHQGRLVSMAGEDPTLLMAEDPQAPLIQLGVSDISYYIPLASVPPGLKTFARRAKEPEAEKKILLDWGANMLSDPSYIGRQLLAAVQDNPRWLALAPGNPGQASQLQSLLDAGAAGTFLYPALSRHMPYDEDVLSLAPVINRFKRPVLIHTGPGPAPLRLERPLFWDEFLQEIHETPVIMVHSGVLSPFWDEVIMLAMRYPHVFLETSLISLELLQRTLNAIGSSRLIFGSGGAESHFLDEWQKLESLKPLLAAAEWIELAGQRAKGLFFDSPGSHGSHKLSVVRRQPG
ncbi:MAG: amidohydrolase family protein [Firmicutes bacterium]|jgi:predicted amidohydrolase|uniref:Acyltransferase n=1 Tax=Sulfobacillus benefaciens TaxID=453960 RepID=A0A2T2WYU8_9FIRM|nr:amidohydrolase family protein [Bacillota bacterium]PSR27417.1 MAG: acyltransferase [Sulfobacillus benefaciens]